MNKRHVGTALVLLFSGSFGFAEPAVPALRREITTLVNRQHTRPHLPPVRTSIDGRLGVNQRIVGDSVRFYLLKPEALTRPFLEPGSPPGLSGVALAAATKNEDVFFRSSDAANPAALPGTISFFTLCDPSAGKMPFSCAPGKDCYDLKVISGRSQTGQMRLYSTPVRIVVDNPKTADAAITSIVSSPTVAGPIYEGMRQLREPMITEDGLLLVSRAGDFAEWTWRNPATGAVSAPGVFDIFYAYNRNATKVACDVSGWQNPIPISHAPFDTAVKNRYGFAANPFRDTEGTFIPDGVDLKATYPWIDRKGRNLFFTTVGASFHYENPNGDFVTRYPAVCPGGTTCATKPSRYSISDAEVAAYRQTHTQAQVEDFLETSLSEHDEPTITRGVTMMGLWTHGKMVLLDGMLNNIDFGTRGPDKYHRAINLYDPDTDLTANGGRIRVGASREFTNYGNAADNVLNTTFVDSIENLFNFNVNLFPRSNRDVIWVMSNGKATTEVIFDDYINTNTFLFSEMTASTSFFGGYIPTRMHYHDGFKQTSPGEGAGFPAAEEKRVQNAATSIPFTGWSVPRFGKLSAGMRIEPIALGGIHGKGLWLEETNHVEYVIPAQKRNVANFPWYVGIFLDPRFGGTANHRILTFPDGTALEAVGTTALRFVDSAGVQVTSLSLANTPLTFRKWRHVGLLVEQGGGQVSVYIDGFLSGRWTSDTKNIFQLTPGSLYLGKHPNRAALGFKGWVDSFIIVAERPSPEVICNHARGSLAEVALNNAKAGLYPAASHLELARAANYSDTNRRFVCHTDYTSEEGASHTDLPAGYTSLRQRLLFPGGIHAEQPRTDTSGNKFCLSCHLLNSDDFPASAQGLTGDALQTSLVRFNQSLPMERDPRRQPLQAPVKIFGVVPNEFYLQNRPGPLPSPALIRDGQGGLPLDRWLSP